MIYGNDVFIDRLERGRKNIEISKFKKLEYIKEEELKVRLVLSKKNYAGASMKTRLRLRTVAYNYKLTRWLI